MAVNEWGWVAAPHYVSLRAATVFWQFESPVKRACSQRSIQLPCWSYL
jgi:hypothetical protein